MEDMKRRDFLKTGMLAAGAAMMFGTEQGRGGENPLPGPAGRVLAGHHEPHGGVEPEDARGVYFFIPPEKIIMNDADAIKDLRPIAVLKAEDRIREDIPAFMHGDHEHGDAIHAGDHTYLDLVKQAEAVDAVSVVLDLLLCNTGALAEGHFAEDDKIFRLCIAGENNITHNEQRIRHGLRGVTEGGRVLSVGTWLAIRYEKNEG